MSEWQPIETAPKDRRVLLFRPVKDMGWSLSICGGHWEDDRYAKRPRPYWTSDNERLWGVLYCRENPPTHWMPLPEPPK